MNGKKIILAAAAACTVLLSACGGPSDDAVKPMLGLEWFTEYDAVKTNMNGYHLLEERESGEQQITQKMQDYSGVSLYEQACDLTLCFTDSGLIGFNYHDTDRSRNYREWFSALEGTYGLPTEQGSGMASWYGNPLGKDTAIYLFNLQEGVQVSFYATSDSPDKSYEKPKDAKIPAPELRTPVVPVAEDSAPVTTAPENVTETAAVTTVRLREGGRTVIGTDTSGNLIAAVTDDAGAAVTDPVGSTVTTVIPATTAVTTVTSQTGSTVTQSSTTAKDGGAERMTTQTTAAVRQVTEAEKRAFLLGGLSFYSSPDAGRRVMNRYSALDEYRIEEPGQPWELVMEYENVPYLGKSCDGILCFTSLGLVGINYFDYDAKSFGDWVKEMTALYGKPDETQSDFASWSRDPAGKGTSVYVFAFDDGVQISFFADDTGSELS